MKRIIALCLVAVVSAFSSITLLAADTPTPAAKGEKKATKHIPFHGKVGAIDKSARTLKVGERTFQVTASTKIARGGNPANLDDATVGEDVGGAYLVGEGGKLELLSLRIGAKPAKEDKK
jgi:hypothetical protein